MFCHLLFGIHIYWTSVFVLAKKIIKQRERAGSTGFCEKALIPWVLMLSIFGKYLIRLIKNFTKVITDYAHLPLLGARANHYFSHKP